MVGLQNGKIVKVLTRDGIPKYRHLWMKNITYYKSMIQLDYPAKFHYDNGSNTAITSCIKSVTEYDDNLIIQTESSVYYIKNLTK